MVRQDFWSGIGVSAFALLALFWIIPNYAGSNPFAQMPPELVPSIAATIMLVCGLVIVVSALVRMIRAGEMHVSSDIDWPALVWSLWPFLYVAVAIYFLTLFKITYVGVPMVAVMLFLLGERRWYVILGCSVAPVALLYFLSVYLMRVGVV
jgi:hypothetical protein